MSGEGCLVGLCAVVPAPIVVEAVGAMRPGVVLLPTLEREAFLVGRRGRGRTTVLTAARPMRWSSSVSAPARGAGRAPWEMIRFARRGCDGEVAPRWAAGTGW